MRCGLLNVSEWDAGVEGSGDEGVPEGVRAAERQVDRTGGA